MEVSYSLGEERQELKQHSEIGEVLDASPIMIRN